MELFFSYFQYLYSIIFHVGKPKIKEIFLLQHFFLYTYKLKVLPIIQHFLSINLYLIIEVYRILYSPINGWLLYSTYNQNNPFTSFVIQRKSKPGTMKLRIWGSIILFCSLLSSVTYSQTYNKYLERSLPSSWQEKDNTFQQTLPVEDQWWNVFQDPLLDSIIAIAIRQNYDLAMALDRIEIARANLNIQRGAYSPTFGVTGGWTKQQSSGHTSSLPREQTHYADAALSMSWEVDVFGSIRNRVRAQKELYAASQEEYNAAMVSLCAQVASSYIQLREVQQELIVAQINMASQAQVLHITEVRYNTGLVSKLDVAQARSVYYDTKASIPVLEAGIIRYINTLAVLLGLYPSDVQDILSEPASLPEYTEIVGVGLPSNLLRRRPDIRAIERQVNAQAAQVGASRSDWWPKFYLKGSVGFASKNMDKFFDHNSLTYEIAPTVSINLFQGGQLINATRSAQSQLNETINQFNQTVLTAVQEVDNAMSSYRNSIKQIVAMREVVNQGKETLQLSLELYKQGLSPFQNVLDAQRSLLSYENALVQAQGNSLLYLIQLYQALGGGWNYDEQAN